MNKTKDISALFVNTRDVGGGAERVFQDVRVCMEQNGVVVRCVVGYQLSNSSGCEIFPHLSSSKLWESLCWKLHGRLERYEKQNGVAAWLRAQLRVAAQGIPGIERLLGIEDFYYPGMRRFFDSLSPYPDVIHLHNLHGGYFDLRYLPKISQRAAVFITLHDEWLYTGHCAHSIDCDRWLRGCGHCPDLERYPAIRRDKTAYNWMRKRKIYQKPRLHLVTPSNWLAERVRRSVLAEQECRVIHNGVDLSLFSPSPEKDDLRRKMQLSVYDFIVLYVAVGGKKNVYKDAETVQRVVENLSMECNQRKICFLELGGDERAVFERGNLSVYQIPFSTDRKYVADLFRCADVYLHAARADTFPTVILEALACGVPVIATAVGGIPEQIIDGVTGFLVEMGDDIAMTNRVKLLMLDIQKRQVMGQAARADALKRFDIHQQVDAYLSWYSTVLENNEKRQK